MIKKKLFGVLNIFDILLILVVIAGIVFAAFYFTRINSTGDEVTVYFTVEFRGKEPGFVDNIIIGSEVKDSIKGYYLGTVYEKEERPHVEMVYDEINGVYSEPHVEGKRSVRLTIKSNGTESDSEIMAEGQVVKMGKEMTIKGKGFASKGYIMYLSTEKPE